MKRIIAVVIVVLIAATSYVAIKSKGAFPAVLPPASITPEQQPKGETVNESNLTVPEGFSLRIFARDMGSVRDLEFTGDGTLLASIPAKGEVVALLDKDSDGHAEETKTVITGLQRPHGLLFYRDKLFVATETSVLKYSYDGTNSTAALEKKLFDLPKGGRHFTRTLAANSLGQLFVSIGSTCDVCFENQPFLAAVIVSDQNGNSPRLFAKGLRNSVFITVNPQTDELWATEMGRDFLGDDLPPDEVNIIKDGRDYGWPLCYGNRVHDTDFDKNVYIQIIPQPPCGETESPVYEIAAHSAPLGLAFITSDKFPKDWQGDLLVAYHGSWNRSTPTGYKVVRIKLENGQSHGEEDFISGFLEGSRATARPVDLIFAKDGSLYVSDDKAGFVFRIDYQN
ncbi:PQQ-dependent sugar dehydrogenase [Candidatus Curtissbacteria bacterium]|nr:PQQ-dependent sugar dehydrogenase [Candidatus Curtissbacteria bacterium]